MGVQPLPVDTFSFQLKRVRQQAPLWQGIALAERVFSGTLLLLLLPLLIAVTFITIALSRRAPLIAHQRIGQRGRPIWVLKFRTMWDRSSQCRNHMALVERLSSDFSAAINVKNPEDPRVTSRFAAVCRRYSIDELPQLWHVFRGEMALIGPRPLTAQEIETYYGSAAHELLSIKPGISGLWQTKGRSRLTYLQRRRLDLFLVRNWSLRLYLKILIATPPTVLAGRHAW